MARVRVKSNFRMSELGRDLIREPDMRKAADEVIDKIKARTLAGTDETGRAFAPTATGAPADLRETGQLLADLAVLEATKHKVRVGFRTERSARVASYLQNGTSRMKARPFIGLPARWVDAFVARVIRRNL